MGGIGQDPHLRPLRNSTRSLDISQQRCLVELGRVGVEHATNLDATTDKAGASFPLPTRETQASGLRTARGNEVRVISQPKPNACAS